MKAAQCVVKILAIAAAVAAVAYTIFVYRDKISEGVGHVANKVRARRQYAEGCCLADGDEDYTDWDE